MKKIYIIILVLFSISVQAQKYYYNGSEKIQLYESEKSFILFGESTEAILKGFEKAELYKIKNFTILKNKISDFSMKKTFEKKSGEISPAYTIEKNGNFELYPTKTVRVKLLPNKSKKDISKLIDENKIFQIKEEYGIIRIKVNNINDVFNTANRIYESGIAEFSLPDFYVEKEVNQVNDPLFPLQYQMNNTGQVVDGIVGVNDIDSNALEAWNINLGDNITVAIVDQGLEAHEDIGNRLVGGHTPLNNGNGQPIANNDTHGMNCAGVLAASDNNIGVRGVAPNVNLLSVNIFAGGETAGDIADGITWAVNNGADIISNSWSLSNVPCGFANADIDNAIQDAVTRGRNQRGCVVVFSSGNDNTFQGGCVDYPATNPNVISVGAIDNRGNLYGYSRRGPELDLVAPSGLRFSVLGETTVGVRTLDRMGTAGNFAGNYRDDFDGTSAACPVVSGAAALVLSVNPNLTQQEVRNILTSTATDMGTNGFDNNFGFGRVNACAAVLSAFETTSLNDSFELCISGQTFSVPVALKNSNITWSVSPTNLFTTNSGTGATFSTTAASGVSGQGKVKATVSTNCGSIEIVKDVWVGKPTLSTKFNCFTNPNHPMCQTLCKTNYYHPDNTIVLNVKGETEWESTQTGTFSWYVGDNKLYIQPYQTGTISLTLRAKNDCGTSSPLFFQFNVTDCGKMYQVYPNPSDDVVYINLVDDSSQNTFTTSATTITGELYDFTGNLTTTITLVNNQGSIPVQNLNQGIYILKLYLNNSIETHQIIVE